MRCLTCSGPFPFLDGGQAPSPVKKLQQSSRYGRAEMEDSRPRLSRSTNSHPGTATDCRTFLTGGGACPPSSKQEALEASRAAAILPMSAGRQSEWRQGYRRERYQQRRPNRDDPQSRQLYLAVRGERSRRGFPAAPGSLASSTTATAKTRQSRQTPLQASIHRKQAEPCQARDQYPRFRQPEWTQRPRIE